ncbi:MAG: hypothetical protein JSV24_11190 [Bacteroidales bacterium]|nr:MAG: hypothetical protein JSV24_11190 [Bacteroidales bacterium]
MTEKTKKLTNIYLIDEQRTYLPEITERFQNPFKYSVISYTTLSKFFEDFESVQHPRKNLNLVFLTIEFEKDDEHVNKYLESIPRIKNMGSNSEVFILSFKMDEEKGKKGLNYGARALIQKNENAVLRITNNIKGIISEKNLEKKRRSSLLSIKVLILFILAVALMTVILYLIFPERFLV